MGYPDINIDNFIQIISHTLLNDYNCYLTWWYLSNATHLLDSSLVFRNSLSSSFTCSEPCFLDTLDALLNTLDETMLLLS